MKYSGPLLGVGVPRFCAAKVRLSVLGVLVAIGAALLAGMSLWSCCRTRRMADYGPLRTGGVPVIRVRLTGRPVRTVTLSSTGPCRLVAPSGRMLAEDITLDDTPLSFDSGAWRLAATGDRGKGKKSIRSDYLEIIPAGGGRVEFGGRQYRGSIRLVAWGAEAFIVVNHVNLESYLAGVLAKELYPHWSPATYRAQAIAARTFAFYQMTHFGRSRKYDLTDTQGSQVYGGFGGEIARAWRAVRDTHGKVLAYGPAGREEVFLAHYSASCGGVVNSAVVLREAANIPPLRGGQRCEDCVECPRYSWPAVKVSKSQLYRSLRAAGLAVELQGIVSVRVVSRTSYGRAMRAELTGPRGAKPIVRFDALRTSLLRTAAPEGRRLYSMNCEIRDAGRHVEFYSGRGFGHGVGLCQWGAQAKARRGWSARRILNFYYPQAAIISKY